MLADVPDPAAFLDRLAAAGVLAVPMGERVRFVAHRDVTATDTGTALANIARAVKS